MSTATPVTIRQSLGRTVNKIFFIILPLSLLPVLLVGTSFLLFGRETLSQAPSTALIYVGLFLAVGLVLTGLIAWQLSRRLTQPLDDLEKTMSAFVAGDWEQRSAIKRDDEIGNMARLFNQMAGQMVEIYWSLTQLKSGKNINGGGGAQIQPTSAAIHGEALQTASMSTVENRETAAEAAQTAETFSPPLTAVDTERQLVVLQTLWNISQTISFETEPVSLFQVIHEQVETVMGELSSFAIALYDSDTDTISLPYMVEEGQRLDIPPFPLGEGLTSIVVNNRQPLLLFNFNEEKAQELGAKIIGVPAKSWLGVPMLFGGEVIGVIIAQDIHQGERFDEEDQQLLSTLAIQAGVVVRNARFLAASRRQAEMERTLNEITGKIRRATGMQGILKTTADELGAALGVRRAHIQVAIGSEVLEKSGNGR